MHLVPGAHDDSVVTRLAHLADPALNRLSFLAMLPAMAERASDVLEADGVVLFLTDDTGELRVRAHVGDGVYEDEIPEVVRRVAATLFAARDGRTGAVALVSEGSLLGVLFARSHDRRFSDDDMLLLQVAANRCAGAAAAARLRATQRKLETKGKVVKIPTERGARTR